MKKSIIVAASILVSGCALPQAQEEDGAYGTVRVPTETDCQYRRFQGHGNSQIVGASGALTILTITGPPECRDPDLLREMGNFLK